MPLSGGNASGEVVRVGDEVHKPWLPTSDRVVAFTRRLRERGLDVPEHRRGDDGCLVLDHVPGTLALDLAPLDLDTVRAVGALVRSLHDTSEGLEVPDDWEVLLPADDPDLLCHHDVATWNLLVDGSRLVLVDWDGAGPSTRLWDLAYAAISFAHLFPGADPAASAERLAALVDGYDADAALRTALPDAMVRRAGAMHELLRSSHGLGREPWSSMYADGHGRHWRDTTAYVARHRDDWVRALRPAPTCACDPWRTPTSTSSSRTSPTPRPPRWRASPRATGSGSRRTGPGSAATRAW
ncbi:tRNA A-37 threonylcarbamoyl transferase component Bud32 [Marmoricola bigeumensis]|uniref:tRNA A-37 threonylcarbamoyl transferase component Bud32 n=1 Tax=Nocardioides marmoribigeumensis TaxID=433649 RepID=A0ABU2C112_9ACTN|nr:tRNA A-37 threonylcarbamoyl transferase component Bud32 [Nocardioides marmoribigeumensis]